IVGLGTFGAALSQKLTAQGNEVIGIDKRMDKVDMYKEMISSTICLDAMEESSIIGLPLKDTDIVIVAIGEDQGANIMATALFKNLQVKRLISRAINPLHEKVLEAIGVDEIVHPEVETAERWTKKLCLKNVVDSFELSEEFSVIEVNLPIQYIGKSIEEVGFRKDFELLVLTTIKNETVKSLIGKSRMERKVQGVPTGDLILQENDILVLYGLNKNLQNFLNQKWDGE